MPKAESVHSTPRRRARRLWRLGDLPALVLPTGIRLSQAVDPETRHVNHIQNFNACSRDRAQPVPYSRRWRRTRDVEL